MRLRRIIGAAAIVVGVSFFGVGIASAHDVTPDEGSQCTSPTTGEVKFNATNMGSEQRDLFVYLNGNLVGSLLDFTGNGSHKVDITVPAGLTGPQSFTWSSDAVMHGDATIIIDWSKPKCQPEVTTTTSGGSTTTICDQDECETTTTATTIATTTTATTIATTTTATTLPTTTTTLGSCAPLCAGQFGTTTTVPSTTTTAAATTTVAQTTTTPSETTAVDQTLPGNPPVVTPAPELPHTGAMSETEALGALAAIAAGAVLVFASRTDRSIRRRD